MTDSRSEQTRTIQNGNRPKSSHNNGSKPPQVVASESLESLKKVIELDTDSSLADLSLLEKLNNEATARYRSIAKEMDTFEQNTDTTEKTFNEVRDMGPKLDILENQIDKLLEVASEIDEWSKELEVKSKRYSK